MLICVSHADLCVSHADLSHGRLLCVACCVLRAVYFVLCAVCRAACESVVCVCEYSAVCTVSANGAGLLFDERVSAFEACICPSFDVRVPGVIRSLTL
jgi:hypothetical protein